MSRVGRGAKRPARLLDMLPEAYRAALTPHVVEAGVALAHPGDPINMLFLEAGLAACWAAASDGVVGEAGLVGPGDLLGLVAAIGAERHTLHAVAITTVEARALPLEGFREALDASPAFRDAVFAKLRDRIAEVERLTACGAQHAIEQRLARWLATAIRLSGHEAFSLTHQQLATLFGVRRATVTASLHLLEGEFAVRCRRGAVEVRDAERLKALACGCAA